MLVVEYQPLWPPLNSFPPAPPGWQETSCCTHVSIYPGHCLSGLNAAAEASIHPAKFKVPTSALCPSQDTAQKETVGPLAQKLLRTSPWQQQSIQPIRDLLCSGSWGLHRPCPTPPADSWPPASGPTAWHLCMQGHISGELWGWIPHKG